MRTRTARINSLWLMLLGSGAAVAVLIALLNWGGKDRSQDADLVQVYCAAGMRPIMEKIAAQYKDEYDIEVEFQFGGSNTLLNQIEVNKFSTYDLYLAADDFYTDQAKEKGLAAETLHIAYQRPVVAVRSDSDIHIDSFNDLVEAGVAISMGDPEQAAIGRAVRTALKNFADGDSALWDQLQERITTDGVYKPTVNDSANDVKVKAVDAAIIWDSTAAAPQYRDVLKTIPLPELETDPKLVSICVLNSTAKPTAALKFARYVTAADRGLVVFKEFGTRPVDGDTWAERPQVNFFCGAVNRRAVEETIAQFEAREGVDVNTKYDGCGFLTGQMKTFTDQRTDLGFPDVYMACDVYYLDNVKDWFQDAALVSDAEIVIAVPKGSDKVRSVEDLVTPGVAVAIGQPEHCTIGALTRRILEEKNLYDSLMEKQQREDETVVEKPSSALLVPDVVGGHVDAAVAYITDVQQHEDRVDIVRVDSPHNLAVQPLSIAKTSEHKQLLRRLYDHVAASEEAFESAGFHFRLGEGSHE